METQKFDRANHCRNIASLGGQATVARYGRGYMQAIAKRGFQAYADAHHEGFRAPAAASLLAMKPGSFRKRTPAQELAMDLAIARGGK